MEPLPRRILVIRLGAIGDVTNALVVATALKDHDRELELGWAVHDLALPLVEGHPHVDRVHLWPRGSGLGGLRTLLADIRARRYDLALDLQRILKSAALARASGAGRILGFDRRRSKELSWMLRGERLPAGDPRAHVVAQYMDFVRALGLPATEPRHVLPRDEAAAARAAERLARLPGAPLVVSVGASKPENRWPSRRFAELARVAARDLEVPVILCGGPSDRKLAAEGLRELRGVEGVHDLVGETTLLELVELLRGARLFVGCDSGPMHLAAAVGTPVVALFGPADPGRTGPWGAGHLVLRPGEGGRSGPMEEIPVERVLAALEGVLEVAAPS